MMFLGSECTLSTSGNVTNEGGGSGTWDNENLKFSASLGPFTSGASYVTIRLGRCAPCQRYSMTVRVIGGWPGGDAYFMGWVNDEQFLGGSSGGVTVSVIVRANDEVVLQFDNNGASTKPAMSCTFEVSIAEA